MYNSKSEIKELPTYYGYLKNLLAKEETLSLKSEKKQAVSKCLRKLSASLFQ